MAASSAAATATASTTRGRRKSETWKKNSGKLLFRALLFRTLRFESLVNLDTCFEMKDMLRLFCRRRSDFDLGIAIETFEEVLIFTESLIFVITCCHLPLVLYHVQ